MTELHKRFGRLVATHRRRVGLTQEKLAERAGVSVETISKIEVGATGARFPVIEKLAKALAVDPAELFTANLSHGALHKGAFGDISKTLMQLPEADRVWLNKIINAVLSSEKVRKRSRAS